MSVETGTAEPRARPAIEADAVTVALSGAWDAAHARPAAKSLAEALGEGGLPDRVRFELTGIERLDTAGAWLLVRKERALFAKGAETAYVGGSPAQRQLIETIRAIPQKKAEPKKKTPLLLRPFEGIGRAVVGALDDSVLAQAVLGRILLAFGATLLGRSRFRFTAFVNQFDLVIFRAVPIVVLISVVVGAIITQQSILQLRNFGAQIFVVDIGAILMLREVGLLLAAIMIAGRSGSAITAEIGSMRMREEVDALSVMGIDPYGALVVPRMLALVIGLPLLAFIGAIAGLAGTALVAQFYGDISFSVFLERLQATLNLRTVMVGLVKAPVMAFIVGLVAINEGLKVEGSAESLGRHTTASVVKSIFLVIVADGLFAIFFAAIGF